MEQDLGSLFLCEADGASWLAQGMDMEFPRHFGETLTRPSGVMQYHASSCNIQLHLIVDIMSCNSISTGHILSTDVF